MATRIKTVEYSFDSNRSSLALATRLDLSAITLFLENQSRVFRSATIVANIETNVTTAASMTSFLLGIKLGATAFNDNTVTDTLANSGNGTSWRLERDVTAYFTSNYGSLVEQTCQVGMQFGAVATINHSVKLVITYEFDDTELLDSGTASSATGTTLVDSGKAWTTDLYKDHYVKITGGTGSGQIRQITGNDGTSVTVSGWTTQPDNTSTYQILQAKFKTARVPLESLAASLTNTLGEIGTNQVPALDTFLPEANKAYRDIFFEVFGGDNNSGTTNFNLAVSLDAEAEVGFGVYPQTLNDSQFHYYTWKRTDIDTSAAHAFKARSNNVTTRFYALCVILNVTYQYLESESTTILNSLMLPLKSNSQWSGGTASGSQEREVSEFFIEEPTTITLVQSAVMFAFGRLGATTVQLSTGSQSKRAYAFPAGSTEIGQATLLQRIDSGGAQGAGVTLARGRNRLTVGHYVSNFLDGCPIATVAILNYTSGKASSGAETHNKTIIRAGVYTATGSFNRLTTGSIAMNIPESSYYLNAVGIGVPHMANEGGGSGRMVLTLRAERLSGGWIADGWQEMGISAMFNDSEYGQFWAMFDATRWFRCHPQQPDTDQYVMNPTSTRAYYMEAPTALLPFMDFVYTYHSITFSVAGNVRGYTGDGSGISVQIFRQGDFAGRDEHIDTVTTSAGGAYTATVYDDVGNYQAKALQGSAAGASLVGNPS